MPLMRSSSCDTESRAPATSAVSSAFCLRSCAASSRSASAASCDDTEAYKPVRCSLRASAAAHSACAAAPPPLGAPLRTTVKQIISSGRD